MNSTVIVEGRNENGCWWMVVERSERERLKEREQGKGNKLWQRRTSGGPRVD